MVRIQASVSKGWLHQETGISFDESYYFEPLERRRKDRNIAGFLDKSFPRYRIHNLESNLVVLDDYDPSFIYVGGIQPNLILGMLLGADFIPYSDRDADISQTPLLNLVSLSELPSPQSLTEAPLIQRWLREIAVLQKSGAGRVIPPFFWDTGGRATIHGFITTALKFFGQDFLFALQDNPGKIMDFHRWYGEACAVLIRLFSRAADIPVRNLHIGECSGTMVGPEDYRRFIVPPMEDLAGHTAPIRLHHCGDCTYLLPEIASIKGLSSLDTGSGTSVEAVRRILGPGFPLDLMPPVELLLKGKDPAEVKIWLGEVLKENGDGPLTINYHLEPGYDENNHLLLHEELYSRNLVLPGRR